MHRVRRHDRDAADGLRQPRGDVLRDGGERLRPCPDRRGRPGRVAHAARRVGAAVGRHGRGDPQEVLRHAVGDPQVAHGVPRRAGRVEHLVPRRELRVGGALRDVAEDRHGLAAGAADDHAQLHRREVLRLVDDHVPVSAQVGVDQPARLVEQRHVARPQRLVLGRAGAQQQVDLPGLEQAVGRGGQPRAVAEERAEELVGGDPRPRLVRELLVGLRLAHERLELVVADAERRPPALLHAGGEPARQLRAEALAAGLVAAEALARGVDERLDVLRADDDGHAVGDELDRLGRRADAVPQQPLEQRRHAAAALERGDVRRLGDRAARARARATPPPAARRWSRRATGAPGRCRR